MAELQTTRIITETKVTHTSPDIALRRESVNGVEMVLGNRQETWAEIPDDAVVTLELRVDGQLIKTLAAPGIKSRPGCHVECRARLYVYDDRGAEDFV